MRWPLALLLLFVATPAAAQPAIVSPWPESVDLTVYRDPNRSPDRAFELDWLEGYALVSETRTVSIPAGESEVRFEGVAGGIVPQSAIVTGFPDGLVERNRDAYLLSPATLLDRSIGRRVTLRRTSRETGEVREMDAIIRSGADGAVVLQTPQGFEALRCSGTPETLVYSQLPGGLSAKPTLSVRVRSAQPVTAVVTLSYLASGFDWQANYIAELSADESRVRLFAWLTLASNDETSFVNADTQAVAGRLNREDVDIQEPEGSLLQLQCWPQSRTSDIPLQDLPPPPPPPPALYRMEAAAPVASVGSEDITVTGSRIPSQERLGDLKLYRLVEPVTVAANSQKQVALLEQPNVAVDLVYRQRLVPGVQGPESTDRLLVSRNRTQEGLGLPLPGGGLVLFASGPDGRRILVGEGSMQDLAVGEDVEVRLGEGEAVRTEVEEVSYDDDDDVTQYLLTVSNDRSVPVRFEGEFYIGEGERFRPRTRLARRDGRPLWAVTVAANSVATLRYSVRGAEEGEDKEDF